MKVYVYPMLGKYLADTNVEPAEGVIVGSTTIKEYREVEYDKLVPTVADNTPFGQIVHVWEYRKVKELVPVEVDALSVLFELDGGSMISDIPVRLCRLEKAPDPYKEIFKDGLTEESLNKATEHAKNYISTYLRNR